MSVSWNVIPVDPDEPQIVQWLQEHGFEAGDRRGRYPTLDELLGVLNSMELPLRTDHTVNNTYSIGAGELGTPHYAQVLGSIEDNGLFDFFFENSGNEESTMLEILKRLSVECGALIILDDMTATPVLVTPNLDVDSAIKHWHRRQGFDD